MAETADPADDEDAALGQVDSDPDSDSDSNPDLDLPDGLGPLAVGDYYNDFSQALGPEWEVYDSIGHAGWGLRRPSAIGIAADDDAAGGSVMTITAEMGVGPDAGLLISGGVKLKRPQIYGRYTMRVRVDPDPAEVTSGVALLWPQSNQWPRDGEIDILETWASRASRTPVESNLHWLNPAASEPYERSDDLKNQVIHPGVNGSEWHVYQLEWREDLLSVKVDDRQPVILSADPDEIADWNMEPTLQLDAFSAPDTPDRQPAVDRPVVMYIDYILVQP